MSVHGIPYHLNLFDTAGKVSILKNRFGIQCKFEILNLTQNILYKLYMCVIT